MEARGIPQRAQRVAQVEGARDIEHSLGRELRVPVLLAVEARRFDRVRDRIERRIIDEPYQPGRGPGQSDPRRPRRAGGQLPDTPAHVLRPPRRGRGRREEYGERGGRIAGTQSPGERVPSPRDGVEDGEGRRAGVRLQQGSVLEGIERRGEKEPDHGEAYRVQAPAVHEGSVDAHAPHSRRELGIQEGSIRERAPLGDEVRRCRALPRGGVHPPEHGAGRPPEMDRGGSQRRGRERRPVAR